MTVVHNVFSSPVASTERLPGSAQVPAPSFRRELKNCQMTGGLVRLSLGVDSDPSQCFVHCAMNHLGRKA